MVWFKSSVSLTSQLWLYRCLQDYLFIDFEMYLHLFLCSCLSPHSPTKSEFIRAKYQMLAFVHKLPCRDDDGVTTKDLSKVRPPKGITSDS